MKNDLDEIKLFEQFLVKNKDLEELESSISKFNIFEAIGVIKQELKHSDFLSYLLNPNENHGLHELFLKRLLQKCSMNEEQPTTLAIQIDTADYNLVEVQREWNHIDIMISIPSINLICAIENKIFSGEGSDQLFRYTLQIFKDFPDQKHLFVYLTPEGIPASDGEWLSLSYSDVSELLKDINEFKGPTLDKDIFSLINHYIDMLERHILSQSHIAELCRKIYNTHKKAIDLINEHKPDIQQEIKDYLTEIITNNSKVDLDYGSKSYIRFSPKEWRKLKFQIKGKGWTKSGKLLLFEFENKQSHLSLKLTLGPGDQKERIKIFNELKKHANIFKNIKTLSPVWNSIYSKKILSKNDYDQDLTKEEIFEKIDTYWEKFRRDELDNITNIINKIKS